MTERNQHDSARFVAERRDLLDSASDTVRELASGVADIASAAKDKAKDLALTARENIKDVATATGDLAVQAKDEVRAWTATASDKTIDAVQEVGQELTALVRRYPIQSLLVGGAIGFLLARSTKRS